MRKTRDTRPESLTQRLGSQALLKAARKQVRQERTVRRGRSGSLVRRVSYGIRSATNKVARLLRLLVQQLLPLLGTFGRWLTTQLSRLPGLGRLLSRAAGSTGGAMKRAWGGVGKAGRKVKRGMDRIPTPAPVKRFVSRSRKRAQNPPSAQLRIRLIAAVFAVFAVVLVMRAGQLQLKDGEIYQRVADRQASATLPIFAHRGAIKDRHGRDLARSVQVDSVFAEPRRVQDPAAAAAALAPLLDPDATKKEASALRASLERKLRSERGFVFLKRYVQADVASAVRALGITGIATQPEPKRFYANKALAAHVIGFVDGEGTGRAGLERAYDDALQPKTYRVPSLRDALGNKVAVDGLVPMDTLEGAELELTLDAQVQHAAQEALQQTVDKYQAQGGVALVLEAKTAEVLALASYPDFNPNKLEGGTREHTNRAISALYEPGSTLKLVTIAAAMDDKLVTSTTTFNCEDGQMRVGNRTIRDANHKYGVLSVTEILKVSSNICAAKIGFILGPQRVHDWLYRFGFGSATGIELPGELRGQIRSADTWREIGLANVAFGQGIGATALQIAQAAQIIANDGVKVAPRLVKAVVEQGERRVLPAPEPQRVLSEATARNLAQMMTEVVGPGGTAQSAAIPGILVAGKTGTAQKIDPVTRAYSRELYIASFLGFLPADRPELVILVLIDEPDRSLAYYGGIVAAPPWKQIALAALAAREIHPPVVEARPTLAAAPVAAPDDALSHEAQALLGLEPEAPAAVNSPAEPGRMPNFGGLELREVLNRSAEVRCDPVVTGTGRVVAQSPEAGAALSPGSPCAVTLEPDGESGGRSGA